MPATKNQRTSERIPIQCKVQMAPTGKKAMYALAINISMGGILLSAAPAMQVGSAYQLLLPGGPSGKVVAEGQVIRSDASGTAIRFSRILGEKTIDELLESTRMTTGGSILHAYATYFKVGQSPTQEACQTLLGITHQQYRTIFLSSFTSCIALAVLFAWLFAGYLPLLPNWIKVCASFVYGVFWLGVVQPTVDLAVIRMVRRRNASVRNALT